jgi:hypothetical protein
MDTPMLFDTFLNEGLRLLSETLSPGCLSVYETEEMALNSLRNALCCRDIDRVVEKELREIIRNVESVHH